VVDASLESVPILTPVLPLLLSAWRTCHAVYGRPLGAPVSNALALRSLVFWEAADLTLASFCFSVKTLLLGFGLGFAFARFLALDFGLGFFGFFAAGFFVVVVEVVFFLVAAVRALGFAGALAVVVTIAVAYDRHCEKIDLASAEFL
jgi:hypothetical protein